MAEKNLLVCFGQSNCGPVGDYAGWAGVHPELDLTSSLFFPSTTSIGAYGDKFTVPGNFPGFANPIDIRARALSRVRYFTQYNPLSTGYKTYPGVGRTRTGATSLINFVVEQTFEAAAVTGGIVLTRFRDQSQHVVVACTPNAAGATLKIVPTSRRTISTTNTGTEVLTLDAAHGWATDTPVAMVFNTGGALPVVGTPLAEATTYYVRSPSGADLQLSLTPGGAAVNFTSGHTSTVYIYKVADAWTNVVVGEQFNYTIAGVTGTNPVVLPLGFGNIRDGTLLGLKLTGTSGANANVSRVITSYNNRTREALLSSALSSPSSADTFTISPQNGAFDRFGLFLPWCPFEAGNVAAKPNPFPPGFNYINHWHVPQSYNWAAGAAGGLMTLKIPFHVDLAVRLQEFTGDETLVLTCDVGGSSLVRNELTVADASDIGWYDAAQMSCWAPGETNGCFQRLCDSIDACIAAAALEGHTLRIPLAVWFQGEADGLSESAADNYYANQKTLFAAFRNFVKSRGLWPKSAESLPIISPQVLEVEYGGSWPFADVVNEAKRRQAAEDRYNRTFTTNDIPNGVPATSGHYTGVGMTTITQRVIDAYRDVVDASDQSGEVDICNAALSLLGGTARILTLDPPDGTAEAALCSQFYAQARDAVLEAGQWSFAMRRVEAEPLDSPSTNWAFAYRKPGDAIKLVAVLPADIGDDYPTLGQQLLTQNETMTQFLATGTANTTGIVPSYQFQQENIRGSIIVLSNVEDAVIRYVARVTDTRQFSSQFKTAVQWWLAGLIAGATISGEAGRVEAERCMKMALLMIGRAGGVDVAQQRIRPERIAPWHKNR